MLKDGNEEDGLAGVRGLVRARAREARALRQGRQDELAAENARLHNENVLLKHKLTKAEWENTCRSAAAQEHAREKAAMKARLAEFTESEERVAINAWEHATGLKSGY